MSSYFIRLNLRKESKLTMNNSQDNAKNTSDKSNYALSGFAQQVGFFCCGKTRMGGIEIWIHHSGWLIRQGQFKTKKGVKK